MTGAKPKRHPRKALGPACILTREQERAQYLSDIEATRRLWDSYRAHNGFNNFLRVEELLDWAEVNRIIT